MQRDNTIDIAKGLAIIAIVVGHVLRGLVTSGIAEDSQIMQAADELLYSFHLAVFAFLSGLFVARGTAKEGSWRYIGSRSATFLYCYVIWTVIQGLVRLASGNTASESSAVGGVIASLWRADTQMWFFGFLIVATLTAAFVRPWLGVRRACATLAVFAVSFVFWGIGVPALFGSSVVFFGIPGWGLLVFFILGAGLQQQGLSRAIAGLSSATVITIATISTIGFFGIHLSFDISNPTESPIRSLASVIAGVSASVAGVVAIVFLSQLLSKTVAAAPLSFIGLQSLEIFLAHVIGASGTRSVLDAIGVESFIPHLIAGVIAGIAFPLALWWFCNRLSFPWLFRRPFFRRRISAPQIKVL